MLLLISMVQGKLLLNSWVNVNRKQATLIKAIISKHLFIYCNQARRSQFIDFNLIKQSLTFGYAIAQLFY